MARGKSISVEARDIIYRVYLYCAIESEKFKTADGYFQKIQQRVADATGVSHKYIYNLLKERGKYRSIGYRKRQAKELKRNLENESGNTNSKQNDQKAHPMAKKVTSHNSLLEKCPTVPFHTSVYNIDDTESTGANSELKRTEVNESGQKSKTNSSLLSSQLPAGLIRKKPRRIKVHQIQPNESSPIIHKNSLHVIKPGSEFIRLHAIPQSAVPKTVLASVHKKVPVAAPKTLVTYPPKTIVTSVTKMTNLTSKGQHGSTFIKVYQIPRDLVPKNVLDTVNKTANPRQIEIKTVPIEFDPGSFQSQIKIEGDEGM